MESQIIDTTVWVQFFRGNELAREVLEDLKGWIWVSRFTVMEIVYGKKAKKDIEYMYEQFDEFGVKIVEVDTEISRLAGKIFEEHYPTGGIGLLDSFIAATALKYGKKLVTHNQKHFKMIKKPNLVVPY